MTDLDLDAIKICARTCATANVRRASRAVAKVYAESLAPTGLEPTQYSLLIACSLVEGATVSKLAELFAMDRSALARNLAVMEKRELLRVKPGEDRRTRKVTLTAHGRAMLAEALPLWRTAQSKVAQKFGAERLERLVGELQALASAVQDA